MIQHDISANNLNMSSLKEFGHFRENGGGTQLKASKGISNYKLLMFLVFDGECMGIDDMVLNVGWKLLQVIGLMLKPGITTAERMECRTLAVDFVEGLEEIRAAMHNGNITKASPIWEFFENLRNRPNVKNLVGFLDCEAWWHSQISLFALRYERENKVTKTLMQFDNHKNLNSFFVRIQKRQVLTDCHRLCKMSMGKEKDRKSIPVYGPKFAKKTWDIRKDNASNKSSFKRDYWDRKTKKREYTFLICLKNPYPLLLWKTVLRPPGDSSIVVLPYVQMEIKHMEYVVNGNSTAEYRARKGVQIMKKCWNAFHDLILKMWRDDFTGWTKRRSYAARKMSEDAYEWTEGQKSKIIHELVKSFIWRIHIIQRMHLLHNSFMDGPIKIGNTVWALSTFNGGRAQVHVGKVLCVSFRYFPFSVLSSFLEGISTT